MASSSVLRTAVITASTVLALGGATLAGASAFAGVASANPSSQVTSTGAQDRGIVCPRGQHAYHAPGGAVSCIANGVSSPAPQPGFGAPEVAPE